jgi:prophage ps2 protein 15
LNNGNNKEQPYTNAGYGQALTQEFTDLTAIRETEQNSLNLDQKAKGDGYTPSLDNLRKILERDTRLAGKLKYNEFTNEIDISNSINLNGATRLDGVADDALIKEIRLYIAQKYKIDFKKSDIADVMEVVARSNQYNPLRSFLLDCEQEYSHLADQKDPFDILRYYLNVKDNQYNRIIFDLFFRGAVAKVFDPSIKFDFVLDLTGEQGVGKTQFFEQLFTDQYFTTVDTLTEKDDKARMVRNWCVFDDEMIATRKASFQVLKRFVTDRKIEFRPPYASSDRRLMKNFVFVRATNQPDYLNDLTGERRFLVAEVFKDNSYRGRKWSEQDRRAFWGAMVTAWRANQTLTLSDSQEHLINTVRERYKVIDDELEALERYLSTPYPERMYFAPINDSLRRTYIYEMMNNGAYLNGNGEEAKIDTAKYGELVPREKMSIALFFKEVFLIDKPTPQQNAKIRLAMRGKHAWEYKRNIKFGRTPTSGFQKVGESE